MSPLQCQRSPFAPGTNPSPTHPPTSHSQPISHTHPKRLGSLLSDASWYVVRVEILCPKVSKSVGQVSYTFPQLLTECFIKFFMETCNSCHSFLPPVSEKRGQMEKVIKILVCFKLVASQKILTFGYRYCYSQQCRYNTFPLQGAETVNAYFPKAMWYDYYTVSTSLFGRCFLLSKLWHGSLIRRCLTNLHFLVASS